jgi:hypothetical protein
VNYGLASTELKDYQSVIDQTSGVIVDAEGKEAPRVPKHTLTTSATWTRPFGDGGASWFLRGDYVYNSKTWLEADNVVYVGALNLVNTRLGIESDRWTATFYIDNLTDDDTPTLATQFPNFDRFPDGITTAFHVVPRRGRNAGLTLLHRF